MRLLLVAGLLLASCDTGARNAPPPELVIESGSCSRYHYDLSGSSLSSESLRQIVEAVGPDPLRHGRFPFMLALCVEGEAGYRPCGERRPSAPNFRHNADVNLARSETLLDPLDGLPPALAPLSSYFATRYRFWIELMRRRLAYLDDREPAALLRPIEGIEIADACRSTTAELPGPDAPVDEPLPALNSWHRCANHEMHASPGQAEGYPESVWRAFLASERIDERVEPLDGCL